MRFRLLIMAILILEGCSQPEQATSNVVASSSREKILIHGLSWRDQNHALSQYSTSVELNDTVGPGTWPNFELQADEAIVPYSLLCRFLAGQQQSNLSYRGSWFSVSARENSHYQIDLSQEMNLRALTEISATRNLTLECAAFHDNTFYSSKIALNGLRLQYPRPEIHHGLSNRGLQVASVSLPRGWPQMMIVWSTQSQSIQINSTGLHWQQLNLNNPTTDIVIPPGHNLSLRWGPTVVSCLLSAENCTPENLELEFSWFQHYN